MFNWRPVFIAEYYSLTARFRSNRRILPLLLFGGINFLIILVFIFIELVTNLLDSENTVINNLGNQYLDTIFLSNIFMAFISFFIPLTLPMSRLKGETGSLDSIISTPIQTSDLFLGVFFAEYILITPVLAGFGSGFSFIIYWVITPSNQPIQILSLIFVPFLSFLFYSIYIGIGLWLGLFFSHFLSRFTDQVRIRAIITYFTSIIALLLLFLVDLILTQSTEQSLKNPIVWLFPPTYSAILIMNLLYPATELFSDLLITSFLWLIFFLGVLITGTLLFLKKIELEPLGTIWTIKMTPKTEKNSIIPLYSRIIFRRFIRDPENIARIFLSIT
ncbi:MAG: hypothetical protein ACXAC7_19095, partial [Candidatus Hodarchaeales archaeon]